VELTILCKPEAHAGNMLFMTTVFKYFMKTCKKLSAERCK